MSTLSTWTIYDHPSDCPDHFAVRETVIRAGGMEPQLGVKLFWTLEGARIWLESQGLTCIPRSPEDDPVIVETWI